MVAREKIQRLSDAIAAKFAVEKIILFGSHAYGTATADSDVDLLVVMEYEGDQMKPYLEIFAAVEHLIDFPCDMIIWRPTELARRYSQLNPIARESLDSGELLYDRRASRVA